MGGNQCLVTFYYTCPVYFLCFVRGVHNRLPYICIRQLSRQAPYTVWIIGSVCIFVRHFELWLFRRRPNKSFRSINTQEFRATGRKKINIIFHNRSKIRPHLCFFTACESICVKKIVTVPIDSHRGPTIKCSVIARSRTIR